MTEPRRPLTILRLFTTAGQVAACAFAHGVVDLFRDRHAAVEYWRRVAGAALYDSTPLHGLPRRDVEQALPGARSVPITLVEYQYVRGDMPLAELVVLCQIVRLRQPKVIFEIGTYLGGTTLQFATNSDAQVYTLDLPPPGHKDHVPPTVRDPEVDVYPDQPGIRFQGSPYADRIQQLFGDSQRYDFTPYEGQVDLVFIDGSHHCEFVLQDSRSALQMVSPSGMVIWHDYACYAPGVVQALNRLARELSLVHIDGTSLVVHLCR